MASPVVLILVAMVSIQYGASLAKGIFPLAGAAGTTALRVGISALILIVSTKLWRFRPSLPQLKVLAVYGASLGAMNLLFYFSLELIPLGIAVAVEFTGPLAVALISSRRLIDLLWAFLAALGIYLILPIDETAVIRLSGVLLALAAGMFWALYIVFGKRVSGVVPTPQATAWGMIFASFVTIPIGFFLNGSQMADSSLIPAAIAIAILSSALPYSLEMKALQFMPAKTFGILMSLEPAIAALVGVLFLSEHLNYLQWFALFCVMVASAGATWTMKNNRPVAEIIT